MGALSIPLSLSISSTKTFSLCFCCFFPHFSVLKYKDDFYSFDWKLLLLLPLPAFFWLKNTKTTFISMIQSSFSWWEPSVRRSETETTFHYCWRVNSSFKLVWMESISPSNSLIGYSLKRRCCSLVWSKSLSSKTGFDRRKRSIIF